MRLVAAALGAAFLFWANASVSAEAFCFSSRARAIALTDSWGQAPMLQPIRVNGQWVWLAINPATHEFSIIAIEDGEHCVIPSPDPLQLPLPAAEEAERDNGR